MKKLRTVLIDVDQKTVGEIEIDDDLNAFYEKLNCRVFDIVQRKIDGVWYDIMCDDEGLLKEDPVVSAADKEKLSPMLVGNLMFFHSNRNGDLKSLDDVDIENIFNNTVVAIGEEGQISPCVLISLR